MKCEKCKGRRHLFNEGKWVKCECLLSSRELKSSHSAGIPGGFTDTIDSISSKCGISAEDLVNASSMMLKAPGGVIQGDLAHSTSYALATFYIQEGLSTLFVDLHDLVNQYFGNSDKVDVKGVEVLFLTMGDTPTNKWREVVLEKVLRERLCKATIFVSTNRSSIFNDRSEWNGDRIRECHEICVSSRVNK